MRIAFYPVLANLAFWPAAGNATTYIPPAIEETVGEVAATGILISGQLIQAFDASKRQPEIIRADQIFIGEGAPRNFVIYRTNVDYQQPIKRDPMMIDVAPRVPTFKLGQRIERIVLVPAKASTDSAANGRWIIHFWGGNVAWGQGFKMLTKEAARLGRLRSLPPPSAQTGQE